jgi:hypothetical protein
VNPRSLRFPWSARVYTITLTLILALALTTPAPAQLRITYEPALTKGPATAAVTIVEFADYQ